MWSLGYAIHQQVDSVGLIARHCFLLAPVRRVLRSDAEIFRRFSDRVVRVRRSDNEEEPQQASDSEPMIDEDPSFDII